MNSKDLKKVVNSLHDAQMELKDMHDEEFLKKIVLKNPGSPWVDLATWKYFKSLEALSQIKKDLTRIAEGIKEYERTEARLARRNAAPVHRKRQSSLSNGKVARGKAGS